MSLKVYDNFLEKDVFDNIYSEMSSIYFPWYYNDYMVRTEEDRVDGDIKFSFHNYCFTHKFYHNNTTQSPFWHLMEPIIQKINPSAILRIKANLNMSTPVKIDSGYHTDYLFENSTAKTAVLYMNTNNGATKFQDGSEIESVANRFVEFDIGDFHSGISSTDTKNRMLINFCYYKES
jgi:uncharacterized protein with LGFP repeats